MNPLMALGRNSLKRVGFKSDVVFERDRLEEQAELN